MDPLRVDSHQNLFSSLEICRISCSARNRPGLRAGRGGGFVYVRDKESERERERKKEREGGREEGGEGGK
jgi:hypothetical protein